MFAMLGEVVVPQARRNLEIDLRTALVKSSTEIVTPEFLKVDENPPASYWCPEAGLIRARALFSVDLDGATSTAGPKRRSITNTAC